MRKLNIAAKKSVFYLEGIPDKYKFIEEISQRYAKNRPDLATYYHAGVYAYENCRKNQSIDQFERFHIWIVQQAVIDKMQEKKTGTSEPK